MLEVSIIIPTYNSAKYIPDAINSILNQTFKDYEIIIVDDGSTDNTREILNKYNSKIRYIYQENKGPSAARNIGIKNAKGKYIAFLDADDIWLPDKLQRQMKLFANESSVSFVYTSSYIMNENGFILRKMQCYNRSRRKILNELYLSKSIGNTSSTIIKKECFDKVGLFDETLTVAEDWDMWLRICQRFRFKCIDEPLVMTREYEGSQSFFGVRNLENELDFIKKVFSEKYLKTKFFLKRKAYSYCYRRAAIAYHENGEHIKAKQCFFRAVYLYPLNLLNKSFFGLLLKYTYIRR